MALKDRFQKWKELEDEDLERSSLMNWETEGDTGKLKDEAEGRKSWKR